METKAPLHEAHHSVQTAPSLHHPALSFSSCPPAMLRRYELALPITAHKSHIVKRKRYTYPPDSIVRIQDYHFG